MSNEGKKVKVHYVGTLGDGTKFDSSRDRGEPLAFTCMAGQMIPGFDAAVRDMQVGQVQTVTIPAADAYGERDEQKVAKLQIAMLPGSENVQVGQHLRLASASGMPMPCTVVAKDDETITLDMNHELAGKDLTFEIELLSAE
ncbi:MAG TPA: peptidylprolyl isomerase [Eggerthellaceae bacterium]|nr:peptidylprolyl isomerase [Eggerthellaceae bacterium]